MNPPNDTILGDRHLRPVAGLNRIEPGRKRSVLLRVSEAAAETMAGQHTAWMLANLLARQFGVVHEVQLLVPRAARLPSVAFFGAEPELESTIHRTISLAGGKAVQVRDAAIDGAGPDIEICVGRSTENPQAPLHIGVAAMGWRAFIGDPLNLPDCGTGGPALGAFFAACLGAGEVFKRLAGLHQDKGRFIDQLAVSLWDFSARQDWRDAPDPSCPGTLHLPPFYLIGAGAVGQAAMAALTARGGVTGHATLIDGETVGDTNLNRYPLATLDDVDQDKVALVRERVSNRGLSVYAAKARWPDYGLDPSAHAEQREDLRREEAAYRYQLVLSCVDRNVPRHAIQNFWPECLMGGSTNNLQSAVSTYDMRSQYECLKCRNPPEPKGPSVEEVAAELGRMSPSEREAKVRERGLDPKLVDAYLASPRCGMLGETEVAKFGEGRGADWSVGFVSVASGTILAAQLFRFALAGRDAFPAAQGNTLLFSFLNPGTRWAKHLRIDGCDCGSKGKQIYERLWK